MTEPSPIEIAFHAWSNALRDVDVTAQAAADAKSRAEAALDHMRTIARGFGEKRVAK
jgi:hypothetical protein